MKQQKLTGYAPNYPKRFFQGAALTAAALVAMGGMTGCRDLRTQGMMTIVEPTEAPVATEGMVAIPEPTEEVLVLDGEVAIWEPTEEPPALEGKVILPEPEQTPLMEEVTTTGMAYVPEN